MDSCSSDLSPTFMLISVLLFWLVGIIEGREFSFWFHACFPPSMNACLL
uniref:Uncharacterized protein n=1 Tax=Anguilla anguilla TaxID=7936 RepID=A0A0E9U8P5_ANGAN